MALICTLDRKTLKAALTHLARVTERRNTIPILSYVRLVIARDLVRLTGTDLDMELSTELPAATEGEGSFCLPLDTLKSAVAKFAGEHVTIEHVGGGKASLSCDAARVMLSTLPDSDWPTMTRPEPHACFSLPTSAFAGAIADALPFASTEETRYYLQGVYFHAVCENPGARWEEHEAAIETLVALKKQFQEATSGIETDEATGLKRTFAKVISPAEALGEEFAAQLQSAEDACAEFERLRSIPDAFRFATTDGHRLARVTYSLTNVARDQDAKAAAANMPDVIIPRKACKVLGALVGKVAKAEHADVRLKVHARTVEIAYGRFVMLTKTIDDTFPDYSRVIPTSNDKHVTVPADAFAVAVDSVASIASEKTRAVAMSLSGGDIILSCSSPENGRSAIVFEGGDVAPDVQQAIGFNAAYLSGVMGVFGSSPVTLSISDAAGPVRIESPDRGDLVIVLMPMRVDAATLTVADVEAMHLNPFTKLQRKAADIVGAIAQAEAGTVGSYVKKSLADEYLRPAIAYLCDQGEPRHVARLKVQLALEIARDGPDGADVDALQRLLEAYERQPTGSFASLTFREAADTQPDNSGPLETVAAQAPVSAAPADAVEPDNGSAVQDLPQDPADGSAEAEPLPEPVADYAEAMPAVVAVAAEPDAPAAEPARYASYGDNVDIVKVLTVTDQAVYVSRQQWENPAQSVLQRFNRDGSQMGERVILRANIARLVPPRNKGDRPLPASRAAPTVDSALSERLERLERIVAGIEPAAPAAEPVQRPKRSAAHVRAIHAYLQLRKARTRIASLEAAQLTACNSLIDERSLRRVAERAYAEAQDQRDRLQVRCDALERLGLASDQLDTAAAGLNGQPRPSIVLPAVPSRARAA